MSEALQATLLPEEKIWEHNAIARAELNVSTKFSERALAILAKRLQEKGKIEEEEITVRELVGYRASNPDYVSARGIAQKLMSDTVIVDKPNGDFDMYALFRGKIRYSKKKDSYKLSLNHDLERFYIALLEHFTVYSLPEFLELDGRYTQRMYHILKSWESCKNGFVEYKIEDLRRRVGAEHYVIYNDFHRRVLIPTKKEIEKKTTMRFDYEPIYTGKKVTAVRFLFHSKPKYNKAPKK